MTIHQKSVMRDGVLPTSSNSNIITRLQEARNHRVPSNVFALFSFFDSEIANLSEMAREGHETVSMYRFRLKCENEATGRSSLKKRARVKKSGARAHDLFS